MSNDAPFIRPVPQRFPGTALSGTQTQLLGSLSFPAAGGVQAVDALGTVLPLANATGSLIPTPDATDSLGEITTPLRWLNGYFTGSVMASMLQTQGVLSTQAANVIQLANSGTAVNYWKFTNSATGVALPLAATGTDANISMTITPKGTGTVSIIGPSIVAPSAAASGIQTALTVNAANNGAVTAATEQVDVDFDLNRIVTWAAGAGPIALQRAFSITAPTYVGDNGAALTITRAATFYVSGAPSQGADITLSNPYAILVDSGTVRFDDQLSLGGNIALSGNAPTITATTADQGIALIPSGIGVVALQGSGAANIVAVDTTGGASRLGFYNIGPVARQVVATGAMTTQDQIIIALQNLGLFAQA